MDPDKALIDLRDSVQRALTVGYSVAGSKEDTLTAEGLKNLLIEVAEGFDNLDEWMKRQGGSPWQAI